MEKICINSNRPCCCISFSCPVFETKALDFKCTHMTRCLQTNTGRDQSQNMDVAQLDKLYCFSHYLATSLRTCRKGGSIPLINKRFKVLKERKATLNLAVGKRYMRRGGPLEHKAS